jgi:hypothetical protein
MCLKRIVIATMLLTIAQWSYGGFVLCYGSDGHIEIEVPDVKNCCKKSATVQLLTQTSNFDSNHCVDIPIRVQKYVASSHKTVSNLKVGLPHYVVSSLPCSKHLPLGRRDGLNNPSFHNQLLSNLKTVVLII